MFFIGNTKTYQFLIKLIRKAARTSQSLFLSISDEVIENGTHSYVKATVTVTDGEKSFSVSANAGIDINKKGMDISQSYGSSSSYARKYALNWLFLIDDTKDADSMDNRKPELKLNTDKFIEAVNFIKGGGDMSAIEGKYYVSASVKKELAKKLV